MEWRSIKVRGDRQTPFENENLVGYFEIGLKRKSKQQKYIYLFIYYKHRFEIDTSIDRSTFVFETLYDVRERKS